MTELIERHFDYVLGPNQDSRLGTLKAGTSIQTTLGMDSDAPFLLRSRAVRVRPDVDDSFAQRDLNFLLMKFSGPGQLYRQQNLIRQTLVGPYGGQFGNPMPVYPEIFYPRQATINVSLANDGPRDLANVTLYFRGVKLFSPGQVKAYEYPSQFGLLPYVYPQGTYSQTDGLTLIRQLPVTTGPQRFTFKVKPDADFVLRGGQAGDDPRADHPTAEVFFTIRDEDEKPYSSDAVHADVLFGNSWGFPTYINAIQSPVGTGPNAPGLFYPEIYVPKNHLIYFDVSRDDGFVSGAVPVDYPLSFIGQKVFQK